MPRDGMHKESASEYARDNQEKRDECECDFTVSTVEAPRATGAVTSVPSSPKPLPDKAEMISDIELQTWHISEGQALNVIVALVETHAAAATDTESSPVREFLVGAYNEDCSDSRAGQAQAQLTTECLRGEQAIQKCTQCFEGLDDHLRTSATKNAREDKWCVDPTTGEVSRPLGWTESMVKDGDYSDQY
ncbi:hypothetical protein QFC21_005047 [Naganishia friedmannii]|uniref:Uncharacterized protein n=1 Tax=Naganishia friedmannii TaxID=89922 RepID=A0ACC2VCV6_9TREE|nr:hypothetical protein QFC21_005047 [Naganishia friedmannii]